MQAEAVRRIMNPSSIAIVGASNNFFKMGTMQFLNIMGSGFKGDLLPVHPKEKTVLGRKAYSLIESLPYAPELAVLVVPTGLVPGMLEDFGRLGTKHAIIISGGFRETGREGRKLEDRVVDISSKYGIRFLGPNCVGIVNTQLPLNITVWPFQDKDGKFGFISQSGTYVTQTLPYLHNHGMTFSKAISVGNGAVIDIVDCLEYLGEDESTKAIGLYIEGIKRAEAFLEVARKVSAKKPIIAQYAGGTEAGARACSSHTGSMAGPDYIYDGLFEQAGVIRAETIEDVYKTGWALASQPPLNGPNVAILTNSGGPGTAIAATCDKNGLNVPEFSDRTQYEIRQFLPGHASAKNPVDLTFHVDMSILSEKIPRVLFGADEIDGVIIHGIMSRGILDSMLPFIRELTDIPEKIFDDIPEINLDNLVAMLSEYKKPLIASSFFDKKDRAVGIFYDKGIPVFSSPEGAAEAMAALYRYAFIKKRNYRVPDIQKAPEEAERIIKEADEGVIDEYRAKKVLGAYGIPTTAEAVARTLDEALNLAGEIGYPVALKVCSSDILHKTESGMVHLNINDGETLKNAFEFIKSKEAKSDVLVSEMVKGEREFMAGVSYFPGFPPCVMFGIGGIFAEAFKDRAIRLAPLGPCDVSSMTESLSCRDMLGSYRGMSSVDMDVLSHTLVALGQLALHFPEIREIDLNPIIITKDGKLKVADALFIKDSKAAEEC